jgi:hypothetical protein
VCVSGDLIGDLESLDRGGDYVSRSVMCEGGGKCLCILFGVE